MLLGVGASCLVATASRVGVPTGAGASSSLPASASSSACVGCCDEVARGMVRVCASDGEAGTGDDTVRCESRRAAIAAFRFSASKAPIPDDFFAAPIGGRVAGMGAVWPGRTLSNSFFWAASSCSASGVLRAGQMACSDQ